MQYVSLSFARYSDSKSRWKDTAYPLSGTAICALGTAALHIAFDTWYYSSRLSKSTWPPVVVPFNAALYNLRSDNLANHGLHPRWLHFVVNAPMIVGIGPWWHCVSVLFRLFRQIGTKDSDTAARTMRKGGLFSGASFTYMLI